ncbi:hypothetical protein ACFRAQ_26470 [Nocardia sp. NPDC056611]|uniref:hypothetical protein n=1 Tax=Nocardia sp. NPDC056611 TaxID=3345877 RepID=UPI003672A0E7
MLPVTPYAYPVAHIPPDGAHIPHGGTPNRPGGADRPPDETANRPTAIQNLPGPILTAAGIVSIALTLTTAGYGELAWSALCGLTGVLCLRFGIGLMVLEQDRIKAAKIQDRAHHGDI